MDDPKKHSKDERVQEAQRLLKTLLYETAIDTGEAKQPVIDVLKAFYAQATERMEGLFNYRHSYEETLAIDEGFIRRCIDKELHPKVHSTDPKNRAWQRRMKQDRQETFERMKRGIARGYSLPQRKIRR